MNKGMLIVIEGIDAAGKSTLAQNLATILIALGNTVIVTKEPGGSQLGKQLRAILQTQPIPITPIAEYLLFAADRAQHITDVVKPALERGAIVISDRMGDSSLAYQGYGRGIDKNNIRMVNQWAMQGLVPDLVFYLKVNLNDAMERIKKRQALTAFEKEDTSFIMRVSEGFDILFNKQRNVITIDGSLSPDTVASLAHKAVTTWQHQSQRQQ